jgi:hypothetical protein
VCLPIADWCVCTLYGRAGRVGRYVPRQLAPAARGYWHWDAGFHARCSTCRYTILGEQYHFPPMSQYWCTNIPSDVLHALSRGLRACLRYELFNIGIIRLQANPATRDTLGKRYSLQSQQGNWSSNLTAVSIVPCFWQACLIYDTASANVLCIHAVKSVDYCSLGSV